MAGSDPPGSVVVTGASSGIGTAAARALARSGFRTFGTYRDPDDARRLEERGVTPLRMDVTDEESVRSAVVAVRAEGRPLTGLVNNAGIPGAGPLELVGIEEVRQVLDVNVLGVLRVTRAFLPDLRAAGGRIVMMGSVSGRVGMPFAGPYAASKHALEGLCDSLRRELLPLGVKVILLQPGAVSTPIWDRVEEMDMGRFAGTPYEEPVRRVREAALRTGRDGLPVERVAEEVVDALTSRRPPTRKLIVSGSSRFWLRLMELLPDAWGDRLIVRRAWR